jgi:hypothetical protein
METVCGRLPPTDLREIVMDSDEADFWALAATHQRFLNYKLCLAESKSDPCNSPIIQAHTIPRSQLDQISEKGHVYSFDASMSQLQRSGGKIGVRKFGVRQFSVLNCFCGRHDNSIFSDVENIPLTFSPRQIALLHYRTVASELYRKIRAVEATNHAIASFSQRRPSREDRHKRVMLEAMNDGQKLGLRDGRTALNECERILDERAYDRLSALVVSFNQMPTIMTVGGFYPEVDFNGRALQDLEDNEKRYETVSFNIVASEGRAAVAMIWLKDHSICSEFVKSYGDQPPNHYTTLAIQASFEHIENTCVQIEWWERLKQVERDLLLRRMQEAAEMSDRAANSLAYTGVTHDDWEFDRLERVNC